MNQAEIKRQQTEEMAGILTLITVFILGNRMQEGGITYMTAAVSICMLAGIAVCGQLSDGLGRILRSRRNKGQYKSVLMIRKSTLLFQTALGLAGMLVVLFLARSIADAFFRIPYSAFILMSLAPMVLLRTVSCVLQGYFQGEGAELPRAVSGILRQILILGFGLLFSNLTGGYGAKVSKLLREENYAVMYSCMGIALGVCVAEVLILLFLTVLFRGSRRKEKKLKQDGMYAGESWRDCVFGLCTARWPRFLTELLSFLPLVLGLFFFGRKAGAVTVSEAGFAGRVMGALEAMGALHAFGAVPETDFMGRALGALEAVGALHAFRTTVPGSGAVVDTAAASGGILAPYDTYIGKYLVICGVLVSVLSILVLPVLGKVFLSLRREENRFARTAFHSGFHICLVHGIFLAVYVAVMGSQISGLLGGKEEELVQQMLQGGSAVIVLAPLSAYFARFLLVMGRKYLLLGAVGMADVVFTVIMVLFSGSGILSLVYGGVAAALVLSITLGVLSYRQLRLRMDWMGGLAVPLGAGGVTVLLCMLLNRLFGAALGGLPMLLIVLIVSGVVYWGMLLVLRNFREPELEIIPGGQFLSRLGQLMHLYS